MLLSHDCFQIQLFIALEYCSRHPRHSFLYVWQWNLYQCDYHINEYSFQCYNYYYASRHSLECAIEA